MLTVFVFLFKGRHVIHTQSGLEEGHCGLIPVGEKCESCITSGLKWNLCEQLIILLHANSSFNQRFHEQVRCNGPSKNV